MISILFFILKNKNIPKYIDNLLNLTQPPQLYKAVESTRINSVKRHELPLIKIAIEKSLSLPMPLFPSQSKSLPITPWSKSLPIRNALTSLILLEITTSIEITSDRKTPLTVIQTLRSRNSKSQNLQRTSSWPSWTDVKFEILHTWVRGYLSVLASWFGFECVIPNLVKIMN